jgi:hypothetical protein
VRACLASEESNCPLRLKFRVGPHLVSDDGGPNPAGGRGGNWGGSTEERSPTGRLRDVGGSRWLSEQRPSYDRTPYSPSEREQGVRALSLVAVSRSSTSSPVESTLTPRGFVHLGANMTDDDTAETAMRQTCYLRTSPLADRVAT